MVEDFMIRQIDDHLYEVICEWWVKHGWPVLPRAFLGNDGYVVFIDDKPILAAFLLKAENCAYGLIDWIVSNPESNYEERTQVFDELMNFLTDLAKKKGMLAAITVARNKSLGERLVKNGFNKTDENVTLYLKTI